MLTVKKHTGTLRDYQQDIMTRIQTEWKKHKSVMVQMPTGTGKTHVLAAVVLDYLQKETPAVYGSSHIGENL